MKDMIDEFFVFWSDHLIIGLILAFITIVFVTNIFMMPFIIKFIYEKQEEIVDIIQEMKATMKMIGYQEWYKLYREDKDFEQKIDEALLERKNNSSNTN